MNSPRKSVALRWTVAFLAVIVAYLLCAFVTWELSPKNWETIGRLFAVFFIVAVACAAWAAAPGLFNTTSEGSDGKEKT